MKYLNKCKKRRSLGIKLFGVKKRELKQEKNNTARGITLVALVVTIVVLLILSGITISALFGDNGIISAAKTASEKTKKSQENIMENIKNLEEQLNNILLNKDNAETKIIPKIVLSNKIQTNEEVLMNNTYTISLLDIEKNTDDDVSVTVNNETVNLPYTLPTSKVENYKIKYTLENAENPVSVERTIKVYNNYTLKNLLPNNNFTDGTTGWQVGSDVCGYLSASNGILSYTTSTIAWTGFGTTKSILPKGKGNHKIYVLYRCKIPSDAIQDSYVFGLCISPGGNGVTVACSLNAAQQDYIKGSGIMPVPVVHNDKEMFFGFYHKMETDTSKIVSIDYFMAIDLTEQFGEGNEPSQEWCDQNLDYFENTKTIKYIK